MNTLHVNENKNTQSAQQITYIIIRTRNDDDDDGIHTHSLVYTATNLSEAISNTALVMDTICLTEIKQQLTSFLEKGHVCEAAHMDILYVVKNVRYKVVSAKAMCPFSYPRLCRRLFVVDV